jgi:hypothetical protein
MTSGRPTDDPDTDVPERIGGRWPVPERSVLASVLGLPPLAAVGIALTFTALGVLVDIVRIGTVGLVFQICYFSGCVLAVCWVRRRNLFGPVVQPPLLIAVTVPVVVLISSTPPPGTQITERLLVVGAPLVNAFPTMAWTTGTVLAIGVARLVGQRPGAGPSSGSAPRTVSDRRGSDAARGEARRPASPPPS